MEQSDYQKNVINPGDKLSQIAAEVGRQSRKNTQAIIFDDRSQGHFRGTVGFNFSEGCMATLTSGGCILTAGDGDGGKPQYAAFLNNDDAHALLGGEVIAMCADDIARRGALAIAMLSNQIDCRSLSEHNMSRAIALLNGYGIALQTANLANATGEIAIMRDSVTAFCGINNPTQFIYTRSGVCMGISHPSLLFDNSQIKPGMSIIGLRERGYRCNGGTRLTALITEVWGTDIEASMQNHECRDFVWQLVSPSVIYSPTVSRLAGWNADGSVGEPMVKIYGCANITGGGIPGKLPEIFPNGIGANLKNMPEPQEVLKQAQLLSQKTLTPITDEQCHTTFHGGCGMMMIVNKGDVKTVIEEMAQDGIDASEIGRTVRSSSKKITLESRFMSQERLIWESK